MYRILFTPEGKQDVDALPKKLKNSLKKEIQKLPADPHGVSLPLREPLEGWRSYHWRYYRILFMLFDNMETIAVAAVGKRLPQSKMDVYRKLERLAREGKLAQKILAALRGFPR